MAYAYRRVGKIPYMTAVDYFCKLFEGHFWIDKSQILIFIEREGFRAGRYISNDPTRMLNHGETVRIEWVGVHELEVPPGPQYKRLKEALAPACPARFAGKHVVNMPKLKISKSLVMRHLEQGAQSPNWIVEYRCSAPVLRPPAAPAVEEEPVLCVETERPTQTSMWLTLPVELWQNILIHCDNAAHVGLTCMEMSEIVKLVSNAIAWSKYAPNCPFYAIKNWKRHAAVFKKRHPAFKSTEVIAAYLEWRKLAAKETFYVRFAYFALNPDKSVNTHTKDDVRAFMGFVQSFPGVRVSMNLLSSEYHAYAISTTPAERPRHPCAVPAYSWNGSSLCSFTSYLHKRTKIDFVENGQVMYFANGSALRLVCGSPYEGTHIASLTNGTQMSLFVLRSVCEHIRAATGPFDTESLSSRETKISVMKEHIREISGCDLDEPFFTGVVV